jgi:hypothetical protein
MYPMQKEQKKGRLHIFDARSSFLIRFVSKCEIDPSNPHGPCLTCHLLSAPLASGIPCLRDKITDAFLYREQSAPSQFFTKRWNSMEIKEITGWASSEVKTIRVTQGFNASYKIEVRKFTPIDGDVLEKFWDDKGVVKSHKIPPYGVADMNKAARILRKFVEECCGAYITGMIGRSDDLLWNTYLMAFKHSVESQVSRETFFPFETLDDLLFNKDERGKGNAYIRPPFMVCSSQDKQL